MSLDFVQNGVYFVKDPLVGEAQHVVAPAFQVLLSHGVSLSLLLVDGTVDLNDQSRFAGVEVHDIAPDGMLASEFGVAELAFAQALPECGLSRGGVLAHFPRAGFEDGPEVGGGLPLFDPTPWPPPRVRGGGII